MDGSSGPLYLFPAQMPASPLDKSTAYQIEWQSVAPVFEACRNFANPSYIYFIGEEDEGYVKIGKAKDPIKRLCNMQVGNPRRLRVERLLVGDREAEGLLHDLWAEYAVLSHRAKAKKTIKPGTEWFTSEIRSRLFPIVDEAAKKQLEIIEAIDGTAVYLDHLDGAIRQAHAEAGHEAKVTAPAYKLGAVAGYVASGTTRI